MKILIVCEDVPNKNLGGLGRYTVTLAQTLSKAGHIVDFMGNNKLFDELQSDFNFPGRFFPELNMENMGFWETRMGIYNPFRRPLIAWRFSKAIMRRAKDYDVVHYHGHFPLLANHISNEVNFVQTRHDQGSDCLTYARYKKHDVCRETSPFSCASCITPRPNIIQTLVSAIAVWIYRRLVARAFLRHKTIFVSDMLRRNFSRTAGEGCWGNVIYNLVDYEILRDNGPSEKTHSEFIEVFIAGKLYEQKGISSFLTEIYNKLPNNMRITIAGDGEEANVLRERFSNGQIHFLGWQTYSNTIKYMRAADILVVPSVWEEPFGLVSLEGLILGKQVLALNRGATPELLRYQRYPRQLSMFDSMSELVAELISLDSSDLVHPVMGEISVVDNSIIIDEIKVTYLRNKRNSQNPNDGN